MKWVRLGLVVLACNNPVPLSHETTKRPPGPPKVSTPASDTTRTFAIYDISVGDSPLRSSPTFDAWTTIGYDLDGRITTPASSDVCTRVSGAPSGNQMDGLEGTDNAWGRNFMPTVVNGLAFLPDYQATPSFDISNAIHLGASTLQIVVTGLTDDPKQSASAVTGKIFLSDTYGSTPDWNPTSSWPAIGPGVTFSGYVTEGTLVATDLDIVLRFPDELNATSLLPHDLHIHHATLAFDHSAPGMATGGVIAGVLQTKEVVSDLKTKIGAISTSLCQGSAFDGLASTLTKASDMLKDGTNRINIECDAISIGVAFTAREIGNPTQVVVDPPRPDPCNGESSDAGLDASIDATTD